MTRAADAFEKLGAFYLGRATDIETGEDRDEPLLYDSRDLTTHAMCVGMTGSGKTGLCVGLLEEAAVDGIPSLVIDPKGVVGHPLYDVATFINLLPEDRPLSEVRPILARRVALLSEILRFPPDQIKAWGQAHCVLAGYWTYEDHGDGWQTAFGFASLYDAL